MAFLKQASLKIEQPEVTFNSWVNKNKPMNIRTAATEKLIEYKKVISDFNPDNFLLTHCTIVASVNTEDASKPVHFVSNKTKAEFEKLVPCKDFYISTDTSKYVNSNGDAWSRDLLKSSYKSFIGAENYVEHVQDPTLSKGKILDAAIREVDDGKSLFVDILVATDKKHKDLVNNIKTGKLVTLSMGSVVAFTICTECGRVAADETELCHHIKFLKRNTFMGPNDGKKRVIAELCGHSLYPTSNKFIEGSWVDNPAFKGAVMRNELQLSSLDKDIFSEKYSSILNFKSPDLRDTAQRIVAAFSLVDKISNTFSKVEDPETVDLPGEEPAPETEKTDAPAAEPLPTEDIPMETPVEETPVEDMPIDVKPEDLPADLKDMGVPPIEEEVKPTENLGAPGQEPESNPEQEAIVEEKAKKPYDLVKEDIKQNLKDQIKKELLEELGIEFKKDAPSALQNVNLNDSIVHSKLKNSLDTIKKVSSIIRKEGYRSLIKLGYTKTDILKLAFISGKYSINKDIYKIIDGLNFRDFSSFRRLAKAVEVKLGRDLEIDEKYEIKKLLKDVCK